MDVQVIPCEIGVPGTGDEDKITKTDGNLWEFRCSRKASKNNGIPKSSHGFIGFSIVFTIHFGVYTPFFGNIHMFLMCNDLISKLQVSNRLAQDVPDMAVAAERLLGSSYSEICWFFGSRWNSKLEVFRFFWAKITMGFLKYFPYFCEQQKHIPYELQCFPTPPPYRTWLSPRLNGAWRSTFSWRVVRWCA